MGEWMKREAIVLLSGGVDSFAATHYMQSLGRKTTCCFVDYGQPAAKMELRAAKSLAQYLDSELKILRLVGVQIPREGEINSRNLFLISAANMCAAGSVKEIVMGIHAGTEYFDCSDEFVDMVNHGVLNSGVHNQLLIAPFIKWSKDSIFSYCAKEQLPLELTYSCERGIDPVCGECLSCRDRGIISASSQAPIPCR